MKRELLKIAKDLDKEKITETEARNLLFGLLNVSGMFPSLNTVRQEIDNYKEKTMQGDKGHFQNGINWAFNHIAKQIKK